MCDVVAESAPTITCAGGGGSLRRGSGWGVRCGGVTRAGVPGSLAKSGGNDFGRGVVGAAAAGACKDEPRRGAGRGGIEPVLGAGSGAATPDADAATPDADGRDVAGNAADSAAGDNGGRSGATALSVAGDGGGRICSGGCAGRGGENDGVAAAGVATGGVATAGVAAAGTAESDAEVTGTAVALASLTDGCGGRADGVVAATAGAIVAISLIEGDGGRGGTTTGGRGAAGAAPLDAAAGATPLDAAAGAGATPFGTFALSVVAEGGRGGGGLERRLGGGTDPSGAAGAAALAVIFASTAAGGASRGAAEAEGALAAATKAARPGVSPDETMATEPAASELSIGATGGTDGVPPGEGTESRFGFGGGASRRPGAFESTRERGGSDVVAEGDGEPGELGVVTRGGRSLKMPAAIAALVPGGGRLGVPTASTGMLGIFGGTGSLAGTVAGTLAGMFAGTLAGAVGSGGFELILPSRATHRNESDRSCARRQGPARARARPWNRDETHRARHRAARQPRARSGANRAARPTRRAR